MLWAIVGDVIGSAYEGAKKYPEVVSAEAGFPLFSEKSKFTDDSVLTIALADALMTPEQNMEEKFREYTLKYPGRWYGKGFLKWVDQDFSDDFVGKSFANGSAMRVAPIGWAGSDLSEVLSLSEKSAKTSHDHPDGIKGAQAIATATYLAKMGATKEEIRAYVQDTFSYPLAQDADQLEKTHDLWCTCQYSVPTALSCFLLGNDFEETVRKAVMLGGDTDTIAAMSGAVAEAFYGGVPRDMAKQAKLYLLRDPKGEELLAIVEQFRAKYVK